MSYGYDSYNKELWIKNKNQERDETYRKIDISAERTLKDEKLFVQYLDIQSRFSDYSVGNALLISLQMPNATIFKDKENWNKNGVQIKQNAESFTILEPSTPYVSPDGKKATYYNPKKMYDISQTDGKPSDKAKIYAKQKLLKAFIHDCPVDIVVVDKIENKYVGAEYKVDEQKLYICRGLEESFMFQSISSELAKISLLEGDNENMIDFKSYCVSYMLCKKYGIDISNYKFEKLPEEVKKMEVKDFRKDLTTMRNTLLDIDSRICDSLQKNVKNKSRER